MLVLCGMQCSLLGMLSADKGDNQNLIFDLIMNHVVSHDDYDAHRKIAVLNTTYNKLIEDTCRSQKKLIEKYIQENKENLPLVTGARSWNKGFNACTWVNYDDNSDKSKDLQLILINAAHNEVIAQSAVWNNFYFPIFEDDIRPFFDKDGQACFYGYGVTSTCMGTFPSFAQYCLDCDGNNKRYCHYFYYLSQPDVPESYCGRSFHILLDYPVLMKAFLQSKPMYISGGFERHPDWMKEYRLNGVTLPEDYKTFKKRIELEKVEEMLYRYIYDRSISYDSLDPEIRKAIDDHYEKQQREKVIEKT
jgi:hypothetical protein